MLNLTFEEPTADERVLLNPTLQVAELLGAKDLDWNGTPLRILVYRYGDGKIVFSCRTEHPRSLHLQTYTEEYINSGFSSEDQFWTILLSFLMPLA